ncbi:ATP-binding protein [Nocardia rhizosphaerae]|uniref:ATP-binding protein n=1 Tax=Nocardia rhizosphaerae TaxID=1691571 RepID=A0ABV8LB99_9NOCA
MVADTAAQTTLTTENDSAESRVTRLFGRFIACGFGFYLFLLAGDIVEQAAHLDLWWTLFAVPSVFGPPIMLAALSFRDEVAALRSVAGIGAIAFVAAAVSWPLAWHGESLSRDPWITTIPGLAGLLAALVWPPTPTLVVLVAAVLPSQLDAYLSRGAERSTHLLPDVLFSLSFCLLYVAAALMAFRIGRVLDDTRTQAHAAAAGAAANRARMVQRSRFNGLLHDWVMSTLLATARTTDRGEVRRQAEITLTKLAELEPDETRDLTPAEFAAYLRTAIADVDSTLPIDITTHADAVIIPAAAAHVLADAAAEAARNSVRHAGAAAVRVVRARIGSDRLDIAVYDNGIGFEPAAVAPHRLGIAVSILGRVRQLPGGAVQLDSHPGAGTTVQLSWQAAQ